MPVTGTLGAITYNKVNISDNPNIEYWGFRFTGPNAFNSIGFNNNPIINNDQIILTGYSQSNSANLLSVTTINGTTNPSVLYCNNYTYNSNNNNFATYTRRVSYDYDNDILILPAAYGNLDTGTQPSGWLLIDTNTGQEVANVGNTLQDTTTNALITGTFLAPNNAIFGQVYEKEVVSNANTQYKNMIGEYTQYVNSPQVLKSIVLANSQNTITPLPMDITFVYIDTPINTTGKANLISCYKPGKYSNGVANANLMVINDHSWSDIETVTRFSQFNTYGAGDPIQTFKASNTFDSSSNFYLLTEITLSKFYSNFTQVWGKQLPNTARFRNMHVVDDDNIYVVGITTANSRCTIQKFDGNGNTTFTRFLHCNLANGGNATRGMGIQYYNGNMYVTFEQGGGVGAGIPSDFIFKLPGNGQILGTGNYNLSNGYFIEYTSNSITMSNVTWGTGGVTYSRPNNLAYYSNNQVAANITTTNYPLTGLFKSDIDP